jgi:riboflavin synthase
MFTGLIEVVGCLRAVHRSSAGARLEVEARWPDADTPRPGDSVAVNGVCLTAIEPEPGGFAADLSPETLTRSTFGKARQGEPVNLERSLRLGDRLGGHLVAGHVDAVVRLLAVVPEGPFSRWRVSLPHDLSRQVAVKGSVALHGVSLTVAAAGDGWFEVALIPSTLAVTVLQGLRVGAPLHLETDVLAKYVEQTLGGRKPSAIEQLFGGEVERA